MAKNHYKEKHMAVPVENHTTAPWADIEKVIPSSQVPIPSKSNVEDAKKWVDTNQK